MDADQWRALRVYAGEHDGHDTECPRCVVAAALAEVERLREQQDDLVAALDAEQNEVVRLAEGIRRHRDDTGSYTEDDERLWALLDE